MDYDWLDTFPNGPTPETWVRSGGSGIPAFRPVGLDRTGGGTVNNQASGLLELASQHQTLLQGLQEIATGTGNEDAAQNPTNVVERPWVNPPDGSVPYDEGTVVAIGAVGTTVTVVSVTIPDGYDGVVKAISWNVVFAGFVNGSGDLKVQILRNSVPVRNFDNILVEKGTVGIPREISPIRVYSRDIISLTVNHVDNPTLVGNIVGSLVGYFYPSRG